MLYFWKRMKKNWIRRSHKNLTQKTKQNSQGKGATQKTEAAATRNGDLES